MPTADILRASKKRILKLRTELAYKSSAT